MKFNIFSSKDSEKVNVQQPESVDLEEQDLEDISGACGHHHHHHHHDRHCHHPRCHHHGYYYGYYCECYYWYN